MAPPDLVDLRSDTVTRPSRAMREAMAAAEVGDDVYGEDPTVRRLEERVAELVGKDASLFVPSGTMANQIALLVLTRRGDEVVIGEGAHLAEFESGAGAAWSGVQFVVAGRGGLFSAGEAEEAIRPDRLMYPRTRVIAVENTHNRAGGRVFPLDELRRIGELGRRRGLGLHLDGARLWNASVASGEPEASLAAPFDTVSVCFSKGLGAPVGSALCGRPALIEEARRYRKMLGGGMRQAGILAAACLFALDHHRQRLADDHRAARDAAIILSSARGAIVDTRSVETNIVNVGLAKRNAHAVVADAATRGVLVNATGPGTLRLVTHLDAPPARARLGAERLARAIEASVGGP